jgi:hypothetical protein
MAAEARDFSYIPMISVAGLGRGDAAATDRVVADGAADWSNRIRFRTTGP